MFASSSLGGRVSKFARVCNFRNACVGISLFQLSKQTKQEKKYFLWENEVIPLPPFFSHLGQLALLVLL